ncbi:hypothetical protein HYC85_019960 [Camellia sinensis]|uniref:Uncharacterized protein n=1 Tax=Camellia sinensis TaxID=4442 RepID=A0A7J7GSB8_CAMSI|nr:hypothetical protein HYC85_019960 [Camellia sinensis]
MQKSFDHLTSKSFHMEQILNTSTLELTSILERQKEGETINYNTLTKNSLIYKPRASLDNSQKVTKKVKKRKNYTKKSKIPFPLNFLHVFS